LGLVGENGDVHSFEPVQEYFLRLKDIATLNSKYNFIVNRCALGEFEGTGKIAVTNLQNIGWNTIVPNFMTKETIKEIQEVPIRRLDNYIKERALKNITLIKIDTEGFEFPVLKGLSKYFENCGILPAIICEIAPTAYPLLGYQLYQLSEYMKKFNYDAFGLNNPNKRIDIIKLENTTNVLFLPQR
jgi:FkbM family methyltransferase